jgi:NAD-dependent deacetylase
LIIKAIQESIFHNFEHYYIKISMKKLIVITGAGMSAESGISTFRDSGGLWEKHNVMDVATPEGWIRNPQLMLNFYNDRRRELKDCQPNAAHLALAKMESDFEIHIITQNIDNLHERAGSTYVLHLHGELTKACDKYKQTVTDIGYTDIKMGDTIGGTQMRPFIVWFGEAVPAMDEAITLVQQADIVVVIGTSLKVYPAASLLGYTTENTPTFIIDPQQVETYPHIHFIQSKATEGVKILKSLLEKTKELKQKNNLI